MKIFEEPKLEVESFEAVDVIAASPTSCEDFGGGASCMFE